MLEADSSPQGSVITAALDRSALAERLQALRSEIGAEDLRQMLLIAADRERNPEAVRDALATRLMEVFRLRNSRGAFALLYELSSQHLLVQVAGCLRRYSNRTDPRDVLQEVFFNVYRYPHRFNCEREDAFRVWSAMIVRNTVLKHLRAASARGRHEVAMEDLSEQASEGTPTPLGGVIDRECERECERVYVTYLHLYLQFYQMLSAREREAIHLVEVEGCSYRDAAERLEIKLENLKMVIFRARRKIHRSMRRVFEGLPPDCRPARDPRAQALEALASGSETPAAEEMEQ